MFESQTRCMPMWFPFILHARPCYSLALSPLPRVMDGHLAHLGIWASGQLDGVVSCPSRSVEFKLGCQPRWRRQQQIIVTVAGATLLLVACSSFNPLHKCRPLQPSS